jgi:hypothetical protein
MKTILFSLITIVTISCKSQNIKSDSSTFNYNIDTTYYTNANYKKIYPFESKIGHHEWITISEYFETNKNEELRIITKNTCDSLKKIDTKKIKKDVIENHFLYKLSKKKIFKVKKSDIGLQKLIEFGLLNKLIQCSDTKYDLSRLQEIKFMDTSANTRRFIFTVYLEDDLGYIEGFLELINNKANKKTPFFDFIKESKVIKCDTGVYKH